MFQLSACIVRLVFFVAKEWEVDMTFPSDSLLQKSLDNLAVSCQQSG